MFKTLANNRRARHEYSILKAMEAGIELRGTEVKSIREGMINLSESYCVIDEKMQAFLLNAIFLITILETATIMIPCVKRRLLLQHEIRRLYGQIKQQGLTLIPLKIYLKQGLIKLEIGLAKGKKLHDKRDTMKKEAQREVERSLKEK